MCSYFYSWYFTAVEFPAVLLDLQTGKIIDEFQQFVLPRENPKLSDFCKTLTGISQVNNVRYTDCGPHVTLSSCQNVCTIYLYAWPAQREGYIADKLLLIDI